METPPSVLALAGTSGDFPGRLLLIGVQPVELEDFSGGLRPAVKRQIKPPIGMALECLAHQGVIPLERLAAG